MQRLPVARVSWIVLPLVLRGLNAFAQHDVGTGSGFFRRGDVNADGHVESGDAEALLSYLNGVGAKLPCLDAADANDDGTVDVADAVLILEQSRNIDHTFKVDVRAGDIDAATNDVGDPAKTPSPGATRTASPKVSPDITVGK